MLDNLELIMYMKFQKFSMTGCRDMDKKYKNAPKMGVSPICDPQDFFQKSGSATFVPLWCPNFMHKTRKSQLTVSEIFKDGRTDWRTNKGDYYGPHQVNPRSKNSLEPYYSTYFKTSYLSLQYLEGALCQLLSLEKNW